MPIESERLRRHISNRDRWFLTVITAVALIATPSAALLLQRSSHPPDPHCVTTTRASIMGAGTYRYCGKNATTACRQLAPHDSDLAAQCKRRALRTH